MTEHNSNRVNQMKKVQKEALELFKKKNQDYGDAFASQGPIGVIVRMGDKINRLCSISKKKIVLIDTESMRDTLIDLHNYAAMAIMLIDENNNSSTISCDNPCLEKVKKMDQPPSPNYNWVLTHSNTKFQKNAAHSTS